MGQSSSTAQGNHNYRNIAAEAPSEATTTLEESGSHNGRATREGWPLVTEARNTRSHTEQSRRTFGIFRRQDPARSRPAESNSRDERPWTNQDAVALESEERPLVGTEALHMQDDATQDIVTPPPLPSRPQSAMSRVGTRFRQRYSLISQANEDILEDSEQTSDRAAPSGSNELPERRSNAIRRRIPILRHLSRTPSTANGHVNTRIRFAPISRPIPQVDDAQLSPHFGVADASRRAPTPSTINAPRQDTASGSMNLRRRSRLSRVRQSISGPLENLFRNSFHEASNDPQTQPLSRRSNRSTEAEDSDYLIPPMMPQDTNNDSDEPLSRTSDATERTPLESLDALLENPAPTLPVPPEQSRQTAMAERDGREGRRLPNLLRGRSSRLIRRDDETPLSRILHVAAAAIAAQLSGTTDALANLDSLNEDHFDLGLDNFVEELNNAAGQPSSPLRDTTASSQLNFWRVFRFANNPANPRNNENQQGPSSVTPHGIGGNRTVTVVVVGVRSVPSSSLTREGGQTLGTGLDALLNLSDLHRAVPPTGSGIGGSLLRGVTGRSRFSRRRLSEIPSSAASGQTDFSRQETDNSTTTSRVQTPRPRSIAIPESSTAAHSSSTSPRNSLNGSSGASSNTMSTATQTQDSGEQQSDDMSQILSRLRSLRRPSPADNNHASSPGGLRYRRRSDSEANRHRQNGARDSRRNGVVAPEGRSWLIYVVGTNLNEDHPALATPTIFSENPTYEDMVNFTNALGPVKPPTASQESVASSNGIYLIHHVHDDRSLEATALEGPAVLHIPANGACRVCLEEYKFGERIRKIANCDHVFHRECVDTWLTTSYNSCPLCRGLGVEQNTSESSRPESTIENTRDIGRAI